jgi:hypothetical protein
LVTETRRLTDWLVTAWSWLRRSLRSVPAEPSSGIPARVHRKLQTPISFQGNPRRPTELSLQTLKASLKTGKITPAEYAARVARLTSGQAR